MQYIGKFGPMNGKVAIQVKVPELRNQVINARLLLPNGLPFADKVFSLNVTKGQFINTTRDPKSLVDWAKACGREEHELAGQSNSRNSVFYEKDSDLFSLALSDLADTTVEKSPDAVKLIIEPESATRLDELADHVEAIDYQRDNSSQQLEPWVAREFFYTQLYRLSIQSPAKLTGKPGLYAVFEDGQHLGAHIEGVPRSALRCMKFGMADRQSIRQRIKSQYFGRSHRAATTRNLVGDALIGRAIQERADFAGFCFSQLLDLRVIWRTSQKEQRVLDKHRNLAETFELRTPKDVREFESPVEREVTRFMQRMRFTAIPANTAGIEEIENAANSLLSDVSHIDLATPDWLGGHSDRIPVRERGLWASDGVEGGRYYEAYRTHPAQLGAVDDHGRPIADWLVRLSELVNARVATQ